jgi:BirA family biotin operon repressor/biotin-[acetyl-CoA-carboxylase] ligase
VSADRYDGFSGDELARRLELPLVVVYEEIGSTLDVAHALAGDGAPAGTLVLATARLRDAVDLVAQWTSERGAGVWLTLVERPRNADAIDVLSLRIGIALAPALTAFCDDDVRLKWPNDLYRGERKLGGILVEARWRDQTPEWVAIGVGINVRSPQGEEGAVGLLDGVQRLDVVAAMVPAIREAAHRTGVLDATEVAAFASRDIARGRSCLAPVSGVVRGIDTRGSLLVDVGSETVAVRTGSLVLTEAR